MIIQPSDVKKLKEEGRVVFVEGSWYPEAAGRDEEKEFNDEHLPQAVRLDLREIRDKESPYPFMLPSADQFDTEMTKIGIQNEDIIVIYGGHHCMSPARWWWIFKYFGHQNVFVLDGGLAAWKDAKGAVETGSSEPLQAATVMRYRSSTVHAPLVVNANQVLDFVNQKKGLIYDARGQAGYNQGHIPSAVNVAFTKCVEADNYTNFQSPEQLKTVWTQAGLDFNKSEKIITSCAGGVTACVLALTLHTIGVPLNRIAVYDGSWSEWGQRKDLPKEP